MGNWILPWTERAYADFSPYIKTCHTPITDFPALRDLPVVYVPLRDIRLSGSHFGSCFRTWGRGVRNGVEDVLVRGVQSEGRTQTALQSEGMGFTYLAERSVDFPSTPGNGGAGTVFVGFRGPSVLPSGMGKTIIFVDAITKI